MFSIEYPTLTTDFLEEATGFEIMEELTTDDDTDSFDLDIL